MKEAKVMDEERQSLDSIKEQIKKKITLKEIGLPRLLILLLAGVFLLFLSFSDLFGGDNQKQQTGILSADKREDTSENNELDLYTENMEERVKKILKKVDGIGDVDVMITLKSSKEQVTLKDTPISEETTKETDSEGGKRENSKTQKEETSVYMKKENGEQSPYVTKELEPTIEGVVVIAKGGGDTKVINEIMDAMEVLFSVPVHKIKVMKMGENNSKNR